MQHHTDEIVHTLENTENPSNFVVDSSEREDIRVLRHEMRTAISQVIGYSEMLLEDAPESTYSELTPDLERIWNAGKRTLDLIESRFSEVTTRRDSGPENEFSIPPRKARAAASSAEPVQSRLQIQNDGESPGRILVVDDNAENRDMLVRRLSAMGCVCTVSADGEDALRILATLPFDVVLLDVMMPGIDGYEALRRIKSDPHLQHIPVLMISALEDASSIIRCIETGATDYLTKPFDSVLLRARVGACLREKRLRDREEQLLSEVQSSLRRERHIADTLQRSLVRKIAPDAFPGLAVASLYEAAWTEAQVGGDLFDGFRLPGGKVAFAVADASGKGIDAAARVAQVKYALRAYARESDGDPAAIAVRLNDFLCDSDANVESGDSLGSFTTLALAISEPGTGETSLISAGSEAPLILRGCSGEVEAIEVNGMPLGIMPGITFDTAKFVLSPGDTLLLYTDGITEARRDSDLLGTDGLINLAKSVRTEWVAVDLDSLAATILEGARAFGLGTLRDDTCLLLMRRSK